MTAGEWVAGIIGGLGVLCSVVGGVYWAGAKIWQVAWGVSELVGESKQANKHAAELTTEVKGMRSDLHVHGKRIDNLEWWARRQDDSFGREAN